MKRSLAFYTGVLDFERVDSEEELADPSFSVPFDWMGRTDYGGRMGKLHSWVGSFLLILALDICASEFPNSWTWDKDPDVRTKHAALEGKTMPPLTVTDWVNGKVSAEEMKGKVVVMDFYATWCGPCMQAIPHNNELQKKYKDKGLVIVGVCTSNRGQEKMETNAKQKGIEYPIARDPAQKSAKAWAVHYYPTYAIVDRKGIVRVVGLQPDHVEAVVKKLLSESVAGSASALQSRRPLAKESSAQ